MKNKKQAPESGFEPESEPRQGLFRQSEPLNCFNQLNSEMAGAVRSKSSSLPAHAPNAESLDKLILTFSRKELDDYTVLRTVGLSSKSVNWLRKAAALLWKHTRGEVCKASVESLRSFAITKYVDVYARRKVINFAKAFLRYLSKTRFDSRYQAFTLFLELPKALKERKHVTARIVTRVDVENVLGAIEVFGLCLGFLLDARSQQAARQERSPFSQIPTDVKNIVWERDEHKCVMCGSSEGIHYDHIIPVAKGGDNTEHNVQLLCKECNLSKRDKIE
ncbi:MAG: HNH endonuclease [Halobacteriota archaeon]